MTSITHLDYETFSEVNLKEVGAHKYARHPSTRIICAAWAAGNGPVKLVHEHSPKKDIKKFVKAMRNAEMIAGHNVEFERLITKYVGKRQWGMKPFPVERSVCTMAVSLYRGFPASLDGAAEGLGLIEQKDPRGQRLIHKLCKPRRPSMKNPDTRWTPETAPQDFEDFYEYCRQDVRTERAIHHKCGNLPASEREIWLFNSKMNERGIPINRKLLNRALMAVEYLTVELEQKAIKGKPFTTLGQRQKILDWCEEEGYPLPDFTADTLAKAVDDKRCPKSVRKVLRARQQCSRSSLKKFDKMLACICDDDTVKGGFMYYGAHTGRWAGRLIQPQNLPRPDFPGVDDDLIEEEIDKVLAIIMRKQFHKLLKYKDPAGALVSCIRGSIQPPPDETFYISDYSNVEGRVLFCLAECQDGIDKFTSGLDLYKDMATAIYKVEYDKVDGKQRKMGKLAILGLGYQMGAATFVNNAASKGVTITRDFAKRVVDTYRREYQEVVDFWDELNRCAMAATLNPGKWFEVNKYIRYKASKTLLVCELPSGRKIHYAYPKVSKKSTPWGQVKDTLTYMAYEKGAFRQVKTFGGLLAENVVQGTARDLLCHSQNNLELKGYKHRMSVHDESVTSREWGTGSVDEVTRIMEDIPHWAKGWPITSDTIESPRFRK